MSDLAASRRLSVVETPGMGPVARRARRCHQHRTLVRQQVRQRKRIPRTPAPPQGVLAHHRETQRDGGERVRHGDFTVRAEREVPGSPKRQQAGTHLFPSSQKFSGQVSNPGDPASAASLIDSKPQVFEIHGPRLEVSPAVL